MPTFYHDSTTRQSGAPKGSGVFTPAGAGIAIEDSRPLRISKTQGSISFKPLRAVVQFGYEGTFKVGGKNYPGSYYRSRASTGFGLIWYYGVSYNTAGNAVLYPVDGSPNTFKGTVWFFDKKGNTIDTGEMTVVQTMK